MTRLFFVLVVASVLGACVVRPGTREEDALGDVDHEPTGDEHRPGQPCLVCHGAAYTPGDEVFSLAGTIYATPDATRGQEDVEVEVIDAEGRVFRLRTNRAGNFYLEEDDATPTFPLMVAVEHGGTRTEMRSPIIREGSCAHCHTKAGPDEASAGRVYVRER